MRRTLICSLIVILIITSPSFSIEIQTPESYFGFKPGTDRMLFNYEALIDYLSMLDEASERLQLIPIDESPMGKPMYIAFISSPDNIKNLLKLRKINEALALNPELSEKTVITYSHEGRVFLLTTLSMHSGEVGPSQSAPLIAYDLVTTEDPSKLQYLEDVVMMMVPCHNPDGMNMIVDHYAKYKDTKYDGCYQPGVYHKYVGHDNNRDFVILSQQDTKAIAKIYNKDWFPQVMVEKHQMGSYGPRYFVPPMHDPIAENVDAGIWAWTGIFGSNMLKDMTEAGLSGVSQHYRFDDYWPGSTETCLWKNVIGMLTECASVQYAKPILIEPNEFSVRGKGLAEYKKSINMPEPWPGGWWRLGDIVQYEIVSTLSLLKTCSKHRQDILKFKHDVTRREVEKGKTEAPYYFILPEKQHDRSEWASIIRLLQEHGIRCFELTEDMIVDGKPLKEGDVVVPMAQPFRAFAKEVLEKQTFPVRHYMPDGEVIRPYDITSWSLPLHRGVTAIQMDKRSKILESSLHLLDDNFSPVRNKINEDDVILLPATENASFQAAFIAMSRNVAVSRIKFSVESEECCYPAGSFVIHKPGSLLESLLELDVHPIALSKDVLLDLDPISMPRIALVESWFHDMDAGWTRFVFDSNGIPFKVIRPGDFTKTDFAKQYDVVVFPDSDKDLLMEGKYKSNGQYSVTSYPPEFTKGIGKEGFANLMTFLDAGGLIISWGRSANLFMGPLSITRGKDKKEEFQFPISNVAPDLKKKKLYVAGALLNLNLVKDHPLTWGLPGSVGVFSRGRPVFRTSIPVFDIDRRVIGYYPEENIVKSGYCEEAELLKKKTGLVWLKKGKGQLVLFGFQPQFRASTQGTYKLLFNALLLPASD